MSSVGTAERVVAAPSETVTTGVTVEGRPVLSTVTHTASVAAARAFAAGVLGPGRLPGAVPGTAVTAPMRREAAVSSALLEGTSILPAWSCLFSFSCSLLLAGFGLVLVLTGLYRFGSFSRLPERGGVLLLLSLRRRRKTSETRRRQELSSRLSWC